MWLSAILNKRNLHFLGRYSEFTPSKPRTKVEISGARSFFCATTSHVKIWTSEPLLKERIKPYEPGRWDSRMLMARRSIGGWSKMGSISEKTGFVHLSYIKYAGVTMMLTIKMMNIKILKGWWHKRSHLSGRYSVGETSGEKQREDKQCNRTRHHLFWELSKWIKMWPQNAKEPLSKNWGTHPISTF